MYDFTVLGLRYVSVATSALLLALGDEGQDLRLTIAEALASAGPIKSYGAARPRRSITYDRLSGMHRLQCGYQLSRRQRLGYVAVRSLLPGRCG